MWIQLQVHNKCSNACGKQAYCVFRFLLSNMSALLSKQKIFKQPHAQETWKNERKEMLNRILCFQIIRWRSLLFEMYVWRLSYPPVSATLPNKRHKYLKFILEENKIDWTILIDISPDLNFLISSKMSKVLGEAGHINWRCDDCLYESKYKTNVMEHVESKHVHSTGIICQFCNLVCVNRKSLRNHVYRYHKE